MDSSRVVTSKDGAQAGDIDERVEIGSPPPRAVLGWLELGCWTMVGLAPFLYWVNGPAVSSDQLAVRSGLVGFALGGGLALRLTAMLLREQGGGSSVSVDSEGDRAAATSGDSSDSEKKDRSA
jgi:hypothetical protein